MTASENAAKKLQKYLNISLYNFKNACQLTIPKLQGEEKEKLSRFFEGIKSIPLARVDGTVGPKTEELSQTIFDLCSDLVTNWFRGQVSKELEPIVDWGNNLVGVFSGIKGKNLSDLTGQEINSFCFRLKEESLSLMSATKSPAKTLMVNAGNNYLAKVANHLAEKYKL